MTTTLSLLVVVAIGLAIYFWKKDSKKRNISLISAAVLFVLFGLISDNQGEDTEVEQTVPATENVTEEDTTSSDSSEASSSVENPPTEQAEGDEYLAEINAEIDAHLQQNRGWALGTLDEDGNPVENGEPYPEYANWVYVHSVEYTGSDVEVQVTEDFVGLSDEEKDEIASAAQGMAMSYAGLESRPGVYVYNGENAVGRSGMLGSSDYEWY